METKIKSLDFTEKDIITTTTDGVVYYRSIAAFPLLYKATPEQRKQYTIGKLGDDVRWEALDEDIHISSLIKNRLHLV